MNKEIFLSQLREYLKILEDREQEDILAEYAQHIDMKMQKGLSEEEAIRDFGPMEELAAEILEAYHVKPDFGTQKKPALLPKVKEGIADGGKFFMRSGRFMKEKFFKMIRAAGRILGFFGRKAIAFAGWIGRPFRKKKDLLENHENMRYLPADAGGAELAEGMETAWELQAGALPGAEESGSTVRTAGQKRKTTEKGTKSMTGYAGGFFRAAGHGIVTLWRLFVKFCIGCMKLFWNCGCLFFSLFTGIMTMLAVFGLGTSVIFLYQGYPFNGIVITMIGAILCGGALTCMVFSMIIRKQKTGNDTQKYAGENREKEVEDTLERAAQDRPGEALEDKEYTGERESC